MSSTRGEHRPASVLIVDDHPMVTAALSHALSHDARVRVVGTCESLAATMAFLARKSVDVVLLDHRLPDGSGLDVMAALSQMSGHAPAVVVMSAFDDDILMDAVLKAGAAAFVPKSTPMDRLALVVASAAKTPAPTLTGERVSLTKREHSVLALVARGLSNKDVAHNLGISDETVKTHLDRVYAKLGVRDRAGAVAVGLRLGLLNLSATP